MHGYMLAFLKGVNDLINKHLRGRGARCHADRMRAFQRPPVDIFGARRKLRVAAAGAATNLYKPFVSSMSSVSRSRSTPQSAARLP